MQPLLVARGWELTTITAEIVADSVPTVSCLRNLLGSAGSDGERAGWHDEVVGVGARGQLAAVVAVAESLVVTK